MKHLLLSFIYISSAIYTYAQAPQLFTGEKIEDYNAGTFQLFSQDSLSLYSFRHVKQGQNEKGKFIKIDETAIIYTEIDGDKVQRHILVN